jgi:hypothetical protein
MLRRYVTILTTTVLLACTHCGTADESPASALAQTGALTGVVVNQQGLPVARASVWGLAHRKKFGPVASGPDGRFRLPGLTLDAPITVWADAPSLARARHDNVRIFAGKDHDIGRLILLPGTRMVGRLVDKEGKPVPHADVKLELFRLQLGHTINSQGTEWTFSADGNGRFATPSLPAGSAQFAFSAAGKVRKFVGKRAEPGTAVVDLCDVTLPDGIPTGGVVIDQEGKPAPEVEVIADYDWDNRAKTDKSGHFALHGVRKNLPVHRQSLARSRSRVTTAR